MIFKNKIIKGKGSYIPGMILSNEELERCNADSKWVEANLGIKTRHIANSEEDVAQMGCFAALDATMHAGIRLSDIDAVIVSTSSPSHFAPSTACQILYKLEMSVPAFDINAVCSGFLYALELGCRLDYENILIVASEKYSSINDWRTRDCVYFGDGAGAVILSKGNGRIITSLYADGNSGDAFVAKAGGFYTIQGKMVYQKAMEVLPDAIRDVLCESQMKLSDIDRVIPHQAGIRVIRDLMQKINFPMEKCVTVMEKYANLASASIPVAMNEYVTADNNILLVAIGSGWTWGSAIIQKYTE